MRNYQYLSTEEQVRAHVKRINRSRSYCVLDTETTSKDPRQAELVDVQVSGVGSVDAVMFPGTFAPLLADLSVPLVLQNAKYDLIVLYRHGVNLLDKTIYDTLLLAKLLDETRSADLGSLIERHLPELSGGYKTDFWDKYDSYTDAPFEEQMQYACDDIFITDKLFIVLMDKLLKEQIQCKETTIHRSAAATLLAAAVSSRK